MTENRTDSLKIFADLLSADEAWRLFSKTAHLKPLKAEVVHLSQALGRVLAHDVTTAADVPSFNRAAMDGYAVRAEDTYSASISNPLTLKVVGAVRIGQPSRLNVGRQQAIRTPTGAIMPDGSDAVVMLEYTEILRHGYIEVYRAVTPMENISRAGEDVKRGEKLLARGLILRSQDIALLAALGMKQVNVRRKPLVAVLSTGNELVDLGAKAALGKVYDVNRYFLKAALKEHGAEPLDLGIQKDSVEAIKSKLTAAIKETDLTLISGGTSVGAEDYVPEAVNSLGSPGLITHGASIRPGKPTALAVVRGKPIVLLPGNPVAAMIAFHVFVRRVLAALLGVTTWREHKVRAKLSRRVPSIPGTLDFLRVKVSKVDSGYLAEPLRITGSSVISSIVRANGLVIIPEVKEGLEEGEEVEVILLRAYEGALF